MGKKYTLEYKVEKVDLALRFTDSIAVLVLSCSLKELWVSPKKMRMGEEIILPYWSLTISLDFHLTVNASV